MAETVTKPGIEIFEDTDVRLEPPFHLVLLDDNEHTYQYVIAMMGEVFGYTVEKGYAIACVVDSQGQAIVMTASRDEVELKQQQIHAYGADPFMKNCKGSMSAVIEPAA